MRQYEAQVKPKRLLSKSKSMGDLQASTSSLTKRKNQKENAVAGATAGNPSTLSLIMEELGSLFSAKNSSSSASWSSTSASCSSYAAGESSSERKSSVSSKE